MKRTAVILALAGVLALGALGWLVVGNASASSVQGMADNVTSTSLVLGGKTIVLDENTLIEGELTPGATVVIKTKQVDGTIYATRVLIKAPPADEVKYIRIEGAVTSVSDNGMFVVHGKAIATDNETEIDGVLAVGAQVEVKVVKQADGTLLAVKVKVEAPRVVTVKIEGKITSVSDNGTFVVRGKAIATDNETEIDGVLAVGAQVDVKAVKQADGTLLAVKVKVEAPRVVMVKIEGKITSVSENGTFVVRGKAIATDNETEIDGALAVGAQVDVKAVKQADGTLLAVKVKVEAPRVKHVVVAGKITGMPDENTIVIGRKTVLTDEETEFVGEPAVGEVAQVRAVVQPDGTLLALKVTVLTKAPRVVTVEIEGKITALSDNRTMVVRGKTIAVDESTKIDGELAVGAEVEVKAQVQPDGSLLALKIDVEEDDENGKKSQWNNGKHKGWFRDGDRDGKDHDGEKDDDDEDDD